MPDRSITAFERCGQEIDRVHGGEAAVATPDGRADGFDDDDFAFAHAVSLGRDLTGRSSSRGVLAVGAEVALAHGRSERGAGLLDATEADGLGGADRAASRPGAGSASGVGAASAGSSEAGMRWSCASMVSSMQRGCDS